MEKNQKRDPSQLIKHVSENRFNWLNLLLAFLALLFSQLPPISKWISIKEIEVKPIDRISTFAYLGVPSFQVPLILVNTGNSEVTIKSIEMKITHNDNGDEYIFRSDTINSPSQTEISPSYFPVKEDKTENITAIFVKKLSENQRLNMHKLSRNANCVENRDCSQEFKDELKTFTNEVFNMIAGSYRAEVIIELENGFIFPARFVFNLNDSTIDFLVENFTFNNSPVEISTIHSI